MKLKLINALFPIGAIVFLATCNLLNPRELTHKELKSYLKAAQAIRTLVPGYFLVGRPELLEQPDNGIKEVRFSLKEMLKGPDPASIEGKDQIIQIVQGAGFEDFRDFHEYHMRIRTLYILLNSTPTNKESNSRQDKQLDALMNAKRLPPEAIAAIQKSRKRTRTNQERMAREDQADESSKQIVKEYMKELKQLYN